MWSVHECPVVSIVTHLEAQALIASLCILSVLVLFSFLIGFVLGRRLGHLEIDHNAAMDVFERASQRNLPNPPSRYPSSGSLPPDT